MRRLLLLTTTLGFCCAQAMAGLATPVGQPAMRLAQAETPLPVPPPAAGASDPAAPAQPAEGDDTAAPEPAPDEGQAEPDDGDQGPDDLSIGEIPVIETMELTTDLARRVLDSYLLVKDKYQDSNLDEFENLQDYVEQSPDGKNFEADIKAAGFADVNAWNLAITTLTFAYSNAIDDQSADILQQIAEIEQDTELAQDMKDRMVASLRAMIPSENNKKVVAELLADPAYSEKLKQLELAEE